jgi:hypothetical protein
LGIYPQIKTGYYGAMLIFLDRQHAGKPNRLSDRGAGLDLNDNGRVDWWEKEAIWTGILSIELELLFLEMGYDVLPISDGKYSDRHKRVNEYSKGHPNSIYLAFTLECWWGKLWKFLLSPCIPTGKIIGWVYFQFLSRLLPTDWKLQSHSSQFF